MIDPRVPSDRRKKGIGREPSRRGGKGKNTRGEDKGEMMENGGRKKEIEWI
jgi:hypothetical protein